MDKQVEQALRSIAHKLDKWARESETGGWSTHHVRPQRELASAIYAAVASGDLGRIPKRTESPRF